MNDMNPNVSSEYSPGLAAQAKERFMSTPVTSEITDRARERVAAVNEGKQLISVVRENWTSEKSAAAEADALKELSRGKKSEGLEAQVKLKKAIDEKKLQEKRVRTLQAKYLKDKISATEFSEAEAALVANTPEVTEEDIKAIVKEAVDFENAAAAKEALIAEARGELPEVDLEEDEKLAAEAEAAEEKMFVAGVRVLEALKNPPDGAGSLDNLKNANLAAGTLARAEKDRASKLDDLTDRLIKRYPDNEDLLVNERDAIDKKLEDSRVLDFPYLDIQEGDRADRLENGVRGEANIEALYKELGFEGGEYVEGGLLDRQMKAEAQLTMLTSVLEETMEEAENDPRLAGKALTVAILRHQAVSALDGINSDVQSVKIIAEEMEMATLMAEAAKKEQVMKDIAEHQKYVDGVAEVKKKMIAAKALPRKIWGKALGSIGEVVRKVGARIERVGNVNKANAEAAELIQTGILTESEQADREARIATRDRLQKELDDLNALIGQE